MFPSLKNTARAAIIACAVLSLSGCSTWSAGTVKQSVNQQSMKTAQSNPAHVALLKGDTNRKYVSLGDITVRVNKTTIFNKAPTEEQVDEALKKRAAKLGADAVILVRYGQVGVSAMSWGSLEGKGRAIKYE